MNKDYFHVDIDVGVDRILAGPARHNLNTDPELHLNCCYLTWSSREGFPSPQKQLYTPRMKDLSVEVIGDHIRAIVFLISDGVVPSNIGSSYVVRQLIRRAVRIGRLLGVKRDVRGNHEGTFLPNIVEKAIELSSNIDPDVKTRSPRILEEVKREELRFVQTLERGEKLSHLIFCI
ncbi:hypothetical protein ACFE04_013972 [Oxalis oulophora]